MVRTGKDSTRNHAGTSNRNATIPEKGIKITQPQKIIDNSTDISVKPNNHSI